MYSFAMNFDRPLTPWEQGLEIFNRIASSLNVVTISKIKGYISQDSIENALKIIEQRHPKLQYCIDGAVEQLKFRRKSDSAIPLQILENNDNDSWQKVVFNELNQAINSNESLWRVTLLYQPDHNGSYLITVMHHTISDGISSITLHSEILSYCGNTQKSTTCPSQVSTLPVLPPVDTLFPDKYKGYRGKIRAIFWLLKLAVKQFLLKPKTLDFEKTIPVEERKCNVIYRQIEPNFTQKLLKRCRAEKTTVQGALCAAMLLAAAKKIQETQATKTKKMSLTCRSFVDLKRRLFPVISNENLGLIVSAVSTFHAIDADTDFWQLAREVKQKVEQGIERGEIFYIISMFKEIFNDLVFEPNKSPLAKKAPLTVEITNVGQVNIPVNYGSLKLEEISFMPSQGIFGGIFFAAITTFNYRMLLNFAFSEPALSKATIEELVDQTMFNITNAC
ncbi:phthiocerol/phthiodiolone dimycocerosyl transferase family protein [Moorena producens]|uniref:phthiocerol/phthiodiolone dimycocerosyl transferase family protein n=1 Tax=Moorena producens TaxID=1155739 RepID=UPI003C7783B3